MAAAPPDVLTNDDFYYPVGVCIETMFFGFYTALYLAALWIWQKRRTQAGAPRFAGWLYLVLISLMWAVALGHIVISVQRFLRVYILEVAVDSKPTAARLLDATQWDTLTHMILVTAMICLGDILVLYRTYIVWHRNIWVVAFPILIHITYLVVNSVSMYTLSHPQRFSRKIAYTWYRPVFPLVFVQNVLTTGLLAHKLWAQHRACRRDGAVDVGGALSLGFLAWLFIETAMLYTLELFVVIVLGAINHPAKGIAVVLLVPTLGIVFVLFSIRVYFSRPSASDRARSGTHSRGPRFYKGPASEHSDMGFAESHTVGPAIAMQKKSASGYLNRIDPSSSRRTSSDSNFGDQAQDSLPTVMISRIDSKDSF